MKRFFHQRHQFRLALCGHKAVEAGAVCLLLMVQGDLAAATIGHLAIASKTGLLAVVPALGITWTRHARHLANRWTSSLLLAVCAFVADALMHDSHYSGAYTEAALTAAARSCFLWPSPIRLWGNTLIDSPSPSTTTMKSKRIMHEPAILFCFARRRSLVIHGWRFPSSPRQT